MKPTLKFITCPLPFFSSPDLSIIAKWVAITIDAYTDSPNGVAMGVRAIQTATNLSAKEVKDALIELKDKGALEVNMGENGEKLLKVFLYKERYSSIGIKHTEGDKPTNIPETLDFEEIATMWSKSCPDLPPISRWTPTRKRKLRSSLKQADMTCQDLYKCFRIIACTPFLSGQSDKFKCTFDWLTANSTHLSKVFEGFYSRSFHEKQAYEAIMRGVDVSNQDKEDDYYR